MKSVIKCIKCVIKYAKSVIKYAKSVIKGGQNMENTKAFELLRRSRRHLSAQQFKTLSGQIKAGDTEGAIKGLETIIKRNLRKETA